MDRRKANSRIQSAWQYRDNSPRPSSIRSHWPSPTPYLFFLICSCFLYPRWVQSLLVYFIYTFRFYHSLSIYSNSKMCIMGVIISSILVHLYVPFSLPQEISPNTMSSRVIRQTCMLIAKTDWRKYVPQYHMLFQFIVVFIAPICLVCWLNAFNIRAILASMKPMSMSNQCQ